MAEIEIKSVDDYVAAQPEQTARALEGVRIAIRKGLPKAEEGIAVTLIQRTTTEAPRDHMYYIGLDIHKKTIDASRTQWRQQKTAPT